MSRPEEVDLLVVEDDSEFRQIVARWFTKKGYHVSEAPHAEAALDLCSRKQFHVGVFDLRMPGVSGIELLKQVKALSPETEVVMLTGEGTIETAVEAMKIGAFDYLLKPFPLTELELICQKAFETAALRKENLQLKELLQRGRTSSNMLGQSAAMRDVFRLIDRAGPTDKAILIQGESGTGKELVARALQRASTRADKPFVVINCAALPENLLESELFGHEKGSFTGAVAAKSGLFEVADGGTLFIDEIGELAPSLQAKLLRVLEDGSMRRVGSLKERRVNVRIIAATNRNLANEVQANRFREDLFYRINVMSLELPPLRQRQGDVPLLIDHFLGSDWQVEPEARQVLGRYHWPGNVRQLINALERAKILADDGLIRLHDLPREVTEPPRASTGSAAATVSSDDLDSVERAHVVDILRREKGNKSRAARALGVTRRSLYRLIERFNIQPDELQAMATLS
jgi:DNA-binding NtrC family response regulator